MRITSFSQSRPAERSWRPQCTAYAAPASAMQKLRMVPEPHLSGGRAARGGAVCGRDTECSQQRLLSGRLADTGCVATSRMSRCWRQSALVLYGVQADDRAGLLLPGGWRFSRTGCTAGARGRMQRRPDASGHRSHCVRCGVAVDSVGRVEPVFDGESGGRCQCAAVAAVRRIERPTVVGDRGQH